MTELEWIERDIANLHDRYFIRLALEDRAGVLGQVAAIFAEHGVSLASVTQPAPVAGELAALIVVTHLAREADVRAAIAQIEALEGIAGKAGVIRVEDTEAWKREAL